jgi:hypothetical protein
MVTFPLAAVGDAFAVIFVIIAIVSAIVNFFKEKNAQAHVEDRQRRRTEDDPAPQSEIENFLNEIGASQPSTDVNAKRQEDIQQRQQEQREELRRRQQQRRQQLQEQQRQRQAQTQQSQRRQAQPEAEPQQRSRQEQRKQQLQKRNQQRQQTQSRRQVVEVAESDFIEDEPKQKTSVSDRHNDSSVGQRHVASTVGDRHMQSAVATAHKLVSKRQRSKSPIQKLLGNSKSVRNAVILTEVLSPPRSRQD